jgi:hypothetical protein
MRRYAGVVLLKLMLLNNGLAQDGIPIGTWRTHFNYTQARHVVATENKIFCASNVGFFSFDQTNNEIQKLSKLNGLSDNGISALHYDAINEALIVGYTSGFVDFIYQDQIISIDEIASSSLDRSKVINDIHTDEDLTFIGSGFGVVVVNTQNASIEENWIQIGREGVAVEVFDIVSVKDTVFLRTNQGIQYGIASTNLLDFNNWMYLDNTEDFRELIEVNETIYALESQNLYRFSDTWEQVSTLPTDATQLYECSGLVTLSADSLFRLQNDQFQPVQKIEVNNPQDIACAQQFWIADADLGLINEVGNQFNPDGPHTDFFSRIKYARGTIYAFDAPNPLFYNGEEKEPNYSQFTDGRWEIQSIEGFYNASDVEWLSSRRFFSSIGNGLLDETSQSTIRFSDADSMITAITSVPSGLWLSSFDSPNPLYFLNAAEEVTSFPEALFFDNRFVTIDVSLFGLVWLKTANGSVEVLDPIEQAAFRLSQQNGLPSSVNQISISVKDDAWLATPSGPFTFFGASFISSSSDASSPVFDNAILFEDENINGIITDGGNRVWIATSSGLWVFDESFNEVVFHFTRENSPLPSNNVLMLAYNDESGEVFVSTDKGMVSYRSASSIGNRIHSNVKVFPNPVRPEFTGQVGINGLATDVTVKITDAKGMLINEVEANGGTASWDLSDLNGNEVVTGVYLLFSSDSDGSETYVGKVAVIR